MKRAFVNANVVDVLEQRVLPGCTVLAEEGRITAVGPDVDTSGAELVDAGGRYLTPGLFNCHVHLWSNSAGIQTDILKLTAFDRAMTAIQNGEKLLRSGVTFARDVGTIDRVACELKKNVLNGKITLCPDLQVTASAICMTGGATWNVGAYQADGVDECRKAARLQIREGADTVKLYSSGSVLTAGMDPNSPQLGVDELSACVQEAHNAGKKTCCHAQNPVSIRNSIAAGVDHIEHGLGMDDDCIALMLEKGLWLDPTVSALYNITKFADRLLPEVRAKAQRLVQVGYDDFRKAYRAGVPCACGSDAGSSFCYFEDTASELIIMVEKCGLTPGEALAVGTINSARMLEVDGELGSITVGKKAHLALFAENPLENIRTLERCLMTVKAGSVLHWGM